MRLARTSTADLMNAERVVQHAFAAMSIIAKSVERMRMLMTHFFFARFAMAVVMSE